MNKINIITLVLLLALACTAALAGEKRWVVSEGTTLKSQASVSSENLANLPVGSELSLVEDAGRWLKVRSGSGREGWVYAGRVSDTPPVAEVSGGEGGVFGGAMQQSTIGVAKADSARSIRGLSPEVTQYAKQRGTPEEYRRALDKILGRSVSGKEIKAFLREGKIGEYAR